MNRGRSIVLPWLLAASALALLPATLGAGISEDAIPAPMTAHAVLERMAERNPGLHSYQSRVHVDVRMLSFPYLAPKLDGTSYYKRPDYYLVVFDRMPGYAHGFQRLFNDVGSPAAWEKNQNVTFAGIGDLNGRPTIVLRLTKKIHSDILDHTLAYVDQASYTLVQMEWYYTSGGKITMTQQYRQEGGYWVLSGQHATIEIPHVRAVADASYGGYELNVPVVTGDNLP
jgi:outer membrane lipoprotein-sorting protein